MEYLTAEPSSKFVNFTLTLKRAVFHTAQSSQVLVVASKILFSIHQNSPKDHLYFYTLSATLIKLRGRQCVKV